MELVLKRRWLTGASTVGMLYVDGQPECFVLEDRYRPPPEEKVKGATAIPLGRYEVRITWSPKFQCEMPLLIGNADFERDWSGVRIHPGLTHLDTEGCLCVGRERHGEALKPGTSRPAYVDLLAKLQGATEPIWLTVELAVEDAICL